MISKSTLVRLLCFIAITTIAQLILYSTEIHKTVIAHSSTACFDSNQPLTVYNTSDANFRTLLLESGASMTEYIRKSLNTTKDSTEYIDNRDIASPRSLNHYWTAYPDVNWTDIFGALTNRSRTARVDKRCHIDTYVALFVHVRYSKMNLTNYLTKMR